MLDPLMLEDRPHWETTFPDDVWGAYTDFRNFLFIVWQHLGLPEPTAAQYEIAHRLQHGVDTTEHSQGISVRWPARRYYTML